MGETEASSHILSNLELTEAEKNELYGKIMHCNELILVLDAVEDYDSYMITETDITNTAEFANSAFRTGYNAGLK